MSTITVTTDHRNECTSISLILKAGFAKVRLGTHFETALFFRQDECWVASWISVLKSIPSLISVLRYIFVLTRVINLWKKLNFAPDFSSVQFSTFHSSHGYWPQKWTDRTSIILWTSALGEMEHEWVAVTVVGMLQYNHDDSRTGRYQPIEMDEGGFPLSWHAAIHATDTGSRRQLYQCT